MVIYVLLTSCKGLAVFVSTVKTLGDIQLIHAKETWLLESLRTVTGSMLGFIYYNLMAEKKKVRTIIGLALRANLVMLFNIFLSVHLIKIRFKAFSFFFFF